MKSLTFFMVLILCLVCMSCSGISNPVLTDESSSGILRDDVSERDIPEFSITINTAGRNTGLFGVWKVRLDPENLDTEIVPARSASAIGNIFDSDLSQFLLVSPCTNCLTTGRVFFDKLNKFNVEFRMKHPFGDITSRPDLHGFDVRLSFIVPAQLFLDYGLIEVMNPDGSTEPAELAVGYIENADGYTSHFDDLILDERYFQDRTDIEGNLNPFVRFFQNNQTPDFDPHAPVGQNVMAVGAGFDSRTVVFEGELLIEGLEFLVVADVAYGQSAIFSNRTDPQYYLPAFHRTEAWRVEYWIENNNLHHLNEHSSAEVVVQVFDWQHSAIVDPAYPDPSNLAGVPESSRVNQVELYVPVLQDELLIQTIPEAGTGTPSDPLQYRFSVRNANHASTTMIGLLAVRDELYGQASPSGRMPIPVSPAGFPYETQDIRDYSMYEVIRINMPHPGFPHPYDGEFFVADNPAFANGGNISLYADFFMDEAAKKFQYRWDLDYDGITFDIDASGNPTDLQTFDPGFHNTALRVRTNTIPPQEYLCEIDLFAEGDVYNFQVPSGGSNGNLLSQTVGRNAGMGNDHFYIAYCADDGAGVRDIYLAIYDRYGSSSRHNLTSDFPLASFNPSIAVVDDGTYDGVYVVFETYIPGDFNLYSTYGNLDGSGFELANIKVVDIDPTYNIYGTDLLYKYGNLYAYYTAADGAGADIVLAISGDQAESWAYYGVINDHTTGYQIRPAVASTGTVGSTWLVWEDYGIPGQGSELILAESYNEKDFFGDMNISCFSDEVYERYANVVMSRDELIIAYQVDRGSDDRQVYIKTKNLDNDSFIDYQVQNGRSGHVVMTSPAIGSAVEGCYTVAYGAYNYLTGDIEAYILDIQAGTTIDNWRENVIYQSPIGNVVEDAAEIYPVILCDDISTDLGSETFVAFMDYTSGATESTNPFTMYFGDIEVLYTIIEGVD